MQFSKAVDFERRSAIWAFLVKNNVGLDEMIMNFG